MSPSRQVDVFGLMSQPFRSVCVVHQHFLLLQTNMKLIERELFLESIAFGNAFIFLNEMMCWASVSQNELSTRSSSVSFI